MKLARWVALGLGLGLLTSLVPACGDTGTCYGCFASAGVCESGTVESGCGSNGAACVVCEAGQVCQLGECLKTLEVPDSGTNNGFDAGVVEPTHPLALTVTIVPDPARLGRNSLSVLVKGANGAPCTSATLRVDVWMPSMGHGSPEVPVITSLGGGAFSVAKVTFSMQGSWRVTVTATQGALAGSQQLFYRVN